VGFVAVNEAYLGLSMIFLALVSLSSKLWHGIAGTPTKILGTIGITVIMGLCSMATVAYMEEKPWSNVPVFWNRFVVLKTIPSSQTLTPPHYPPNLETHGTTGTAGVKPAQTQTAHNAQPPEAAEKSAAVPKEPSASGTTKPETEKRDTVKEFADELRKEFAKPPRNKSCQFDQLLDCSAAEVLDQGKPLLERLQGAIDRNWTMAQQRHQDAKRLHNEALLQQRTGENAELNRCLEKDYKNFALYRAAVLAKLKGGDPTASDPVRDLALPVFGGILLTDGRLTLRDQDSHFSQADLILRDLQDLSGRLARQIEQDSKKN
jgi:hypothetical protein